MADEPGARFNWRASAEQRASNSCYVTVTVQRVRSDHNTQRYTVDIIQVLLYTNPVAHGDTVLL